MVIVFPKTLRTSAEDLCWMTEIATRVLVLPQKEEIVLDFSSVRDFDENLCAALGVFVNRWKSESRRVSVNRNAISVLSMFKRNHFLNEVRLPYSWYNYLPGLSPDKSIGVDGSDSKVYPIPYRRFDRTDTDAQADYVKALFNAEWWPRMTDAVKDALISCLLEVFNNAEEHSESDCGVFVCGYVRKAGQRQLRISIADAGIGFRAKIEKTLGKKMLSARAIEWGMTEGNTVRQGNPGGLGLKLLKEFIVKNDGRLNVLSDRGFWELASGKEKVKELDFSFPGTVITIVVNTDDPKSYRLANEVDRQRG